MSDDRKRAIDYIRQVRAGVYASWHLSPEGREGLAEFDKSIAVLESDRTPAGMSEPDFAARADAHWLVNIGMAAVANGNYTDIERGRAERARKTIDRALTRPAVVPEPAPPLFAKGDRVHVDDEGAGTVTGVEPAREAEYHVHFGKGYGGRYKESEIHPAVPPSEEKK